MNGDLDTAAAPLSCGQQRLWFLSRLAPLSTSYVVAARFRVAGPLDVPALEHAVREMTRRHEVLRAVFAAHRGRPRQATRDECPPRIVDLSGTGHGDREREWDRLSKEETTRPFDLAADPLFRFTIARMDGHDHRLSLSMHHIVSDKASVDILLSEIAAIYAARLRGEAPDLPVLPMRYSDFSRWQQEWLSGPECAEQLAYWSRQLAGAPTHLPLGGAVRPQQGQSEAAGEPLALQPGTAERLREFAAGERASLFMVLLAAYGLAVGRCYGLSDVVIACPVSSRPVPGTERLVGFFVNTVPVRIRLREYLSFQELLGQVRGTVFGALENSDLPFDRIVSAVHPPRVAGRPPFFQAVLNYLYDGGDPLRLPGLEVTALPAHSIAARAELALDVVEAPAGAVLSGELLYDPGLQSADSAAHLMASLRSVLETALDSPGSPLG